MIFKKGKKTYSHSKRAHLRFGRRGERIAVKLIKQLGLEILALNYTAPHGEIDIVARDGLQICFIEVKTRKPSKRSRPVDAVTLSKKKNLIHAGGHYIRSLNYKKLSWRFDIIEIVLSPYFLLEARYWPGEFTAEELRNSLTMEAKNRLIG